MYRHHDAIKPGQSERETIIHTPVFMFTGRRVGQQPRVVSLLSPRACGLNVTLREASEGAGRLNVSSILARRQPRLRRYSPEPPTVINVYFVQHRINISLVLCDALIALIRRSNKHQAPIHRYESLAGHAFQLRISPLLD